MQQDKLSVEEQALNGEEAGLLVQIGKLARIIAYIGFAYALFISGQSFYSILKVADNTELWAYYKTIAGFMNILMIILSGLLYWFMSWQLYTFGHYLVSAIQQNKQHRFYVAWQYLSKLMVVVDLLLILFLLVLLFTYTSGNY